MNGGFLVNLLAAICITHIVSQQTEPTQLNISTPTNSTIGNTTQFYVGKTTTSSGKIISNNVSVEESIMSSTPEIYAQECCKTTQSSGSETSQPATTFSEGNSSFSCEAPASAEAERISGTTPLEALQTSDIEGGNTPTSISSPLSQSETMSVSIPTQGSSESQTNKLSTTLSDIPRNVQTDMKTTKMSTQSQTETKDSDATEGTTPSRTINTMAKRNTQSGQKISSEASPMTDSKATTDYAVVSGTGEPTSAENQSSDSLKTDSASTQSSAGTTKPDTSTTETQMESTEPAALRTAKTGTSTVHYTQAQMMEDTTRPLPPLLETSATGTTRKSTSSHPLVTRAAAASSSELQTPRKNDITSFTTHFQNTSGQITLNLTTETQTADAEASKTTRSTKSSIASEITFKSTQNVSMDFQAQKMSSAMVSPPQGSPHITSSTGQSNTQGLETSTTSESLTTQLPKTSKQTAPHTTVSLVTSAQETPQTAAHTITPKAPETASAEWTTDQYSSASQSLGSSSSQKNQSISLVPVSTSRSTSSSVPAQSSSHSTAEEAHSSDINMEKATVKSTAAEHGITETTDSNLYTSSADLRHANTTQLEYDASALPVSRNRTVFFKYSPRVVIVKPLVFHYPVVARITFLSNGTDKIHSSATNIEKATVKSTAAEHGSTETTHSNLYTSSADLRHASTTQLEYDASAVPVSRNRTVLFKYSPRVVIVKPLVFDYKVVERITFLSNDADKTDGTTN
ncbi:flocculation protein FLO11-like [Poecilia reticulata]|uniref:flocculation protein FLO11-like n=1 Tax=Poecilia reticulata TaxID=8081 RepID=UPI0004A2A198|nr:PREDICTED: flocculation protein FLO11-like [Poecilia reticulata]